MDSPYFNPSSSHSRSRASSNISISSTSDHNSIRKRSTSQTSRPRSISTANVERYRDLLSEQYHHQLSLDPTPQSDSRWGSSQASAVHLIQPPHIQETAPTPTADQQLFSLPSLAIDCGRNTAPVFTSTDNSAKSAAVTTSASMASLGYLPAPQYGNLGFHNTSFDPRYRNLESTTSNPSSSNLSALFSHDSFSSQPLYAPGPLSMEPSFSTASVEPSLAHISDPLSNLNRATSPYQQAVYDGIEYPHHQISSSRSISHSPMSQHQLPVGSISPQLSNGLERSPNFFEPNVYSPPFASPPMQSSHHIYQGSQSFSYPPPQQMTSQARQNMSRVGSESHVRVLNQKPKPQCWDHGCNGREFSTFSNLLRHQREKSGTAAKSYCPKCGAEFTRTTARNGHLAHEKCSKPRRPSTEDK